jgi:hypothetical protein
MLCSAKEVCDDLNQCIDEVAHYDTRGDDLGVRVLLLVQVPRTTHPQEFAIVSRAVQHQDYDVKELKIILHS